MENNCNHQGGIFKPHVFGPNIFKQLDKFDLRLLQNRKNRLKKLIRQYRRGKRQGTPLCHMLINLRTFSGAKYINKNLKDVLLRKDKHREYYIKDQVLIRYGSACFTPRFDRFKYGNKTVLKNGKWVSEFAHGELPF